MAQHIASFGAISGWLALGLHFERAAWRLASMTRALRTTLALRNCKRLSNAPLPRPLTALEPAGPFTRPIFGRASHVADGLLGRLADHRFDLGPVPSKSIKDRPLHGLLNAALESAMPEPRPAAALIRWQSRAVRPAVFSRLAGSVRRPRLLATTDSAETLGHAADATAKLGLVNDVVTVLVPPLESAIKRRRTVARRRGDGAQAREYP